MIGVTLRSLLPSGPSLWQGPLPGRTSDIFRYRIQRSPQTSPSETTVFIRIVP